MKNKLRFGALIGLVAIVAIVVGVLVWPTPKEARADTEISISVKDVGDFSTVSGLQDILHYTLFLDNEPVEAGAVDEIGSGIYKIATGLDAEIDYDSWQLLIDPEPLWLDFPGEPNPTAMQSWSTTSFT